MIDKKIQPDYSIERVHLANGGDVTSQLMNWALSPKNLERLRNNKGLVKQLTKMKVLPSSVRLYIRNLAGVTDKITEDFFSKSELAEIKKRVTEAKAAGSMGYPAQSGRTRTMKDDVIGYSYPEDESAGLRMSLKGAFTDPAVNINMTLGQATFDTDKDGNVVVKDIHDFHGIEGAGYEGKDLSRELIESAVPHARENWKKNIKIKPEDHPLVKDHKAWLQDIFMTDTDTRRSSRFVETNKQFLKRAHKELLAGNIDPSKYARIVAGLEQGEGIPVEIDVGKISHEDKLKADPFFADYIAQDTKSGYGVEYEDVGIPTLIREQARKYLK